MSSFPDEAKFGKKLMEKMGWAEGEGLGASGQGMLDPIMLRKKDDNKVKLLVSQALMIGGGSRYSQVSLG